MAREFNKFFLSVFTTENTDHMPIPEAIFHEDDAEELCDIQFDASTVYRKLNKLREDKAMGADGLSPRLLLLIKEQLTVPLNMLFRKSLDEGQVPEDWRTANVCPIFKKGKKSACENYRPISLTSQIGKIFESIIRDALVEHLEKNRLIKDSQHGFRTGRSCLSNLLSFLDMVSSGLDKRCNMDVVYLDFAKAFDKVPHKRLLEKLRAHGIRGRTLLWIKEWLSNRTQRVGLNGLFSDWGLVSSGVPQGSILGPVLFLVFINDLDCGLMNTVLKFADDTKLVGKVGDDKDRLNMQQDLDSLTGWANKWQMQFNVAKCKVMHIGHSNPHFTYEMAGKSLVPVEHEKDLGILIEGNMKVSAQCVCAAGKANQMLGMIKRTFKSRNPDILIHLYKTIVRPHLEYATAAWSPHYIKDRELIERVQHRFTRMCKGLASMEYMERLQRLGLWTLEERRNRSDLIEVFRMYRGLSATPFTVFFELDNTRKTRGHEAKLRKHHSRLDIRRYFFSVRVVGRWNALSEEAVRAISINSFKRELTQMRRTRTGFFMD